MNKQAKQLASAGIQEWMYQVIRQPVITEKATMNSANNAVVFEVRQDATKPQIKAAVESLFGVQVVSVNTTNLPGKTKIFKGRKGTRSDRKKATVRLVEGTVIDVTTGLAGKA